MNSAATDMPDPAELSPPADADSTPVDPSRGQEAAAPVFVEHAPSLVRSRVQAGPGLLESLLWILAFFGIQMFGFTVAGVCVAAVQTIARGGVAPSSPAELMTTAMPWMIGTAGMLEVMATVVAIRLRFGRQAFRLVGFRPLPAQHLLILGLAVLPTAILSSQCYALVLGYWDLLAENVEVLRPLLEQLEDSSSIKAVEKMAAATPLAALVFVIGVLPALNEEFLFRAALGRGLLARYGLVAGIALTSMLFAAVHLSPVHAAALVPLAVLMHVGYLSSGSIWASVGVHFCNNAMSVVLMKVAVLYPDLKGAAEVADTKFSPVLFLASGACVATTVWLLLRVRLRWLLPDGREWQPEFPGVEPPPPGAGALPHVPPVPPVPLWTTAVCYLAFPVAFGVAAMLNQV